MANLTRQPVARLALLGAVALVMVSLIFFDVIFLHRSLQPSNISPQTGRPADWRAAAILPSLNPNIDTGFGFGDLGATAWQGEPARYLMARDFREGQSPFWNPYSASGTLGPETLVDIKFSPLTLISAYFFNASPESFDFGLIILYCLAVFFVLLVLHHHLQLSLLSALAAALVFLLNGFSLPNLNSQNGQPYFFAPILLYTLFAFSDKKTIGRWIGLVLAQAMMLTITILPTLLLALATTHLLSLAYFSGKKAEGNTRSNYLLLVSSSFLVALLLVAPLWFPIIDSFFVSDMMTSYTNRATQIPREFSNLLSVLTPKHFWENYSEILHASVYPNAGFSTKDDVIAHTGIIAALIASYAITRESLQRNHVILISLALLLLSYLRVFGCLGFVDHLHILRSIGLQYFGCASAIALTVLVAYGMENILSARTKPLAAIFVLAFLVLSFLSCF